MDHTNFQQMPLQFGTFSLRAEKPEVSEGPLRGKTTEDSNQTLAKDKEMSPKTKMFVLGFFPPQQFF